MEGLRAAGFLSVKDFPQYRERRRFRKPDAAQRREPVLARPVAAAKIAAWVII
jgi:hypothetical protein